MTKTSKQSLPVVVQVVEAFGGGVFQSLSQLCNGLKDSARFVIVHDIRAETPKEFAQHFPEGTQFIHFPMGRSIKPSDAKTILPLRKLLVGLKPHAVHAHSSKAGALIRLALLGTGIPRFYSPRGYSFDMSDASRPKRVFYWLVERALGLLPATTVACGYAELNDARWVSWKSTAIPNSIDPDVVPAAKRKRPPVKKELHVVSSGRISPQKNFPLFCKVAQSLSHMPIRFTWVGGGTDPLPELPANVTVTGWLPHAEGLARLNEGHVYLHLTSWEGLSRILLEAMAHGFPLVVSNIPPNKELANAGNGFICHNAEDATNAITKLFEDNDLLTKMSKASLHHLETRYNWHNAARQWKALYKVEA